MDVYASLLVATTLFVTKRLYLAQLPEMHSYASERRSATGYGPASQGSNRATSVTVTCRL